MLTTQQVKEFLEDQWELIIDLNISVRNMFRLKESRYEFEEQIKKHGFFQHHWCQLKFISVIQLAKLFSSRDTDRRSFHKFCSVLESAPFDNTFVNHLCYNASKSSAIATSRVDLQSIIKRTRFVFNENDTLIMKVMDARDEIYAHKDPNPRVKSITSEEIKIMVTLANQIFNDFEFNIFFKTTMFEEATSWDIDYVLLYMSELRKKDLEELERKKKSVT